MKACGLSGCFCLGDSENEENGVLNCEKGKFSVYKDLTLTVRKK